MHDMLLLLVLLPTIVLVLSSQGVFTERVVCSSHYYFPFFPGFHCDR